MRLSFVAVTSEQQFRDLLVVRNECREDLTHHNEEITLVEQRDWQQECWQDTLGLGHYYEPYLLYDEDWPIGYGLLKWDGLRYWMTIGVITDYRGFGLSYVLTALITDMGHRNGLDVWLDCRLDSRGLSAYKKHGYEQVGQIDDQIIMMRHKR